MKCLLIPSSITINIPALSQYVEYLQSVDQSARIIADLTAQLGQSSTRLQTAVDSQPADPPPGTPTP